MKQVCNFNPASDVERVQPGLSMDVTEAMLTHQVASTGVNGVYDEKSVQPSEVGHYLTDKIQTAITAMRMQKSMSAARQSASPSSSPSTPSKSSE